MDFAGFNEIQGAGDEHQVNEQGTQPEAATTPPQSQGENRRKIPHYFRLSVSPAETSLSSTTIQQTIKNLEKDVENMTIERDGARCQFEEATREVDHAKAKKKNAKKRLDTAEMKLKNGIEKLERMKKASSSTAGSVEGSPTTAVSGSPSRTELRRVASEEGAEHGSEPAEIANKRRRSSGAREERSEDADEEAPCCSGNSGAVKYLTEQKFIEFQQEQQQILGKCVQQQQQILAKLDEILSWKDACQLHNRIVSDADMKGGCSKDSESKMV